MPYADSGDVRIHYMVEGDRHPVLLLPGLGMSAVTWAHIGARLSSTHRVIYANPRGSGDSDAPDEPYTGVLVAADMAAVLDAARVPDAHVVGTSMGGMIAQHLALEHPDRVRSLTLIATYAAPDDRVRRVLDAAIRNLPPRLNDSEAGMSAYLRQLEFCRRHDTSGRLSALELPTQVIVGSHDLLVSTSAARQLAELVSGARYEEVERASHALIWERSEWLTERLADFCSNASRITAPRASNGARH